MLEGFNPFDQGIFLSHLIMTTIILISLIASWRFKKGGYSFIVIGMVAIFFFSPLVMTGLVIGGVLILTGLLFLIP